MTIGSWRSKTYVSFHHQAYTAEPDELSAHARENLSAYKCPKRFFVVDELPRNEMGKVLKDDWHVERKSVCNASAGPAIGQTPELGRR
jgi:acyl-CoA synthetase (AMP-forming)/AMP-acid ligase II